MFIRSNSISYEQSQQLVDKFVTVRLLGLSQEFLAKVKDHCFEGQTGIIILLDEISSDLKSHFKSLDEIDGKFSIDARNIWDGHLIEVEIPIYH